jgi:hypothetical protein
LILVLNRKIPFIAADGERHAAFPIGTHLFAMGEEGVAALHRAHRAGLGLLLRPVSDIA